MKVIATISIRVAKNSVAKVMTIVAGMIMVSVRGIVKIIKVRDAIAVLLSVLIILGLKN